jgi:capsid protein
VVATKDESKTVRPIAVSEWRPELRDRVKAVLNPGARLEIAADDFDSTEQFVTVAHAAHDTNIPFMVLKDRVVNHGESLADAIHESRPELNAKAEVTRARAAARADLELAS